MIAEKGERMKLVAVLNPWARYYRGKVVTVVAVPSSVCPYDADVQARDGRLLAVNWNQLESLQKDLEAKR